MIGHHVSMPVPQLSEVRNPPHDEQAVPDSYAAFCRNLRIRVKDRFVHPFTAGYWAQCIATDRMSRVQLLALQERRLRKLMQHAIRHVPFYRTWGQQAGYTPENPPPLSAW